MIQSLNPFTNQVERTFPEMTQGDVENALARAQRAFEIWRRVPVRERAERMKAFARLLREKAPELALLPTVEMGKLFKESRDWEVAISADIAEYYAQNAERFLAPETLKVKEGRAYVLHEPVGVILGVMPWNFPYYQVLRFAAPNLMAGNACLVKHASNVPQCGIALEGLFREAGFPDGLYTNLLVGSRAVAPVLKDRRVRGVSLTGSEAAGAQVAETAGRALKKAVMELGGSDPFIVLEDADVDRAVGIAFEGKMFNVGQCCAAAKRFILLEPIADRFVEGLRAKMAALEPGDPRLEGTTLAPMAGESHARELLELVNQSVARGAKVLLGGDRPDHPGAFVRPTMLAGLAPGMPAFDRELFGPVANIFVVANEEEAVRIANGTDYGLGSAICTRDPERAARLATRLEAGMVYVNTFTISQPELPFGGVKNSGFGRELARFGIEEFLNRKLVRFAE